MSASGTRRPAANMCHRARGGSGIAGPGYDASPSEPTVVPLANELIHHLGRLDRRAVLVHPFQLAFLCMLLLAGALSHLLLPACAFDPGRLLHAQVFGAPCGLRGIRRPRHGVDPIAVRAAVQRALHGFGQRVPLVRDRGTDHERPRPDRRRRDVGPRGDDPVAVPRAAAAMETHRVEEDERAGGAGARARRARRYHPLELARRDNCP